MATIRINTEQWEVLAEDQKAHVLAILQHHGTLQPTDIIVGDSTVEAVYCPVDTDRAATAESQESEAVCNVAYAIAVAACQSIAPPGSTACVAVATMARNLCRETIYPQNHSTIRAKYRYNTPHGDDTLCGEL